MGYGLPPSSPIQLYFWRAGRIATLTLTAAVVASAFLGEGCETPLDVMSLDLTAFEVNHTPSLASSSHHCVQLPRSLLCSNLHL
jgi:hypothetical protein